MNYYPFLLFVIFASLSLCIISPSGLFRCMWSTYRPGPYFGLRSSIPSSPLFGLMWYYPQKMDSVKSMRHFMEISNNIRKYEWQAHNGCDYGEVILEDPTMRISFSVSFTNQYDEKGGNHWIVSVKGLSDDREKGIVFMWYLSNSIEDHFNGVKYENSTVSGRYYPNETKTNFFTKTVQDPSNTHPKYNGVVFDTEYYLVLNISEDKLYDPSEYIIGELKDTVGNMPNHLIDAKDSYRSASITKGNVFVQQMFFIESFRFDVHFFDNEIKEKTMNLQYVSELLQDKKMEFNRRFSLIFRNTPRDIKYNTDPRPTALSALSTLFSNIIYMNGNLHILDIASGSAVLSKKMELLTIGPDKTSHSRGFMWDEGFQQRILSLWDIDLSLRIISNWFQNIDDKTGWLPREQSLDNESRARAPPSSWASIPNVSNPPSLFLFIENLSDRKIDPSLLKRFLANIIEQLEKNGRWYLNSQESSIKNIYAWKGKTDDFCLPSGMDDYPRAKLNGLPLAEGHLDLQSWMIALCRIMIKIYRLLDTHEERLQYWISKYESISNNLFDYFWDEKRKRFDDFYIDATGEKLFSKHTGYLQLFPLILEVFDVKDLKHKEFIDSSLELLLNRDNGLRTEYGIRSLSSLDPYYHNGQNYWTGNIWININYLIIKYLNKLRIIPNYTYLSPFYNDLLSSVVENMVRNFNENGYIWEVYDDVTGNGKYNHPFTGWSALIVNLIYEKF